MELELQALSLKLQEQPPASPKVNGTSVKVAVAEAAEKLAASEARVEELLVEVGRLKTALDTANSHFLAEEKRSAHLKKA